MKRTHFYKSMTTYPNSRVWQDVYHVPVGTVIAYVKFTVDETDKLIISFKRK